MHLPAWSFRGSVWHPRLIVPMLPMGGLRAVKEVMGLGVTTTIWTRSPDLRIRVTTCSWDAWDTSSPLIWGHRGRKD